MVLERDNISLLTLNMHFFESGILSQCLLAITHTMTFEVRFCRQVNSIFITEVIPARIIRIVACTYSIDIQLFHYLNILNHTFYRHYIATIRIQLMTVNALDQDWLPIHQQLSFLDLHPAETDTLDNDLLRLIIRHLLFVFTNDLFIITRRKQGK